MDFQDGGVPHETPVGAQRTYRVQFREERRARALGVALAQGEPVTPWGSSRCPLLEYGGAHI